MKLTRTQKLTAALAALALILALTAAIVAFTGSSRGTPRP